MQRNSNAAAGWCREFQKNAAKRPATAFIRMLFYRRKISLAVPWHSRQSEPVATHGLGALDFSVDVMAGKP
jgi:hypothetical protein